MAKNRFNSIIQVVTKFPNEQACLEHLKELRWKDGVVCPHCGNTGKIYTFKDNKTFKCGDKACYKKFTAKVGTIFEDSALPLQKWFMAMYLITSHKKGISSLQLSRDIDVTQKTAWFMLQRLRFASKTKSFNRSLSNMVEVDETYIGGKEKNKHNNKRTEGNQGRSTKTKTPVVGMMQRDGEMRAEKVANTKSRTIKSLLVDNVVIGSKVFTDEYLSYRGIGYIYDHLYVKHHAGEYVNGIIHTNGVENFWSMLKRGIVGIYHHVTPKHLDRYLDEFTYRYNSREMSEEERFNMLLSRVQGRLQYKELISNIEQ